MRMKWKAGGGAARGRFSRSLTAALLVACMFLALPLFGGTAWAIDLEQACSLTVAPGPADWAEDLEKANVVVDLYQVAGAREVSGYDTYSFRLLAPYTELEGEAELEELDYDASLDAAGWRDLAARAAALALEKGTPIVTGAPVGSPITATDAGNALGAGLYLLIARGESLGAKEDYMAQVKDEDTEEEKLVTIARSPEYEYTFLPELISLPSKEAAASEEDENLFIINTANPGDWIYDLSVALKPERALRFGSLEIIKTLNERIGPDPAMFVFQIEATLGEGDEAEVVFSDVVALTFYEGGEKRAVIERIPVGATVTVTEVYDGAHYTLVSENDQTAVISAEELASVSFTNTGDDEQKGGFGIVNHFEYNGLTDWTWEQLADNSVED